MKHILFSLFLLIAVISTAQISPTAVDLEKYSGKWLVIATIPTRFDKNWNYVTESYTVKKNGKIAIYTTYTKVGETKTKDVNSKGFPNKKNNNVTWKVQFIWPFRTDYLIEELGPDYSYVVVLATQRKAIYTS